MTTEFEVTPELKTAVESMLDPVKEQGLYKLASNLLGIDTSNDRAVFEYIGTKLAMQRLEWRRINKGLAALQDIAR
jgi:hypothetical protein